ncbi:MAG: hypothetical protein RLY82_326 [Pseudomonadota bacterium]|jgi:glycosyltransferase involved in cell wall biosynthesis
MKIAMLMSVYGDRAIGGAERTAAQMAKLLVLRGHSVHLLSLSPKGEITPLPKNDEGVICEAIPLNQWYDPYNSQGSAMPSALPKVFLDLWASMRKAFWHIRDIYNFKMVFAVRQKLIQIQPDILFTHTLQGFSVGVWTAAQSLGIKVVHMTHDHALICPGTAMTRGAHVCERVCGSCSVFSRIRRAVAINPNAIIGPSEVVLERHRRFGWFKNVTIQKSIPNALPVAWQASEEPSIQSQSEFTIDSPIIFGFLGRIDESKGADTLVTAVSLLPENLLGRWRVILGGQGSLLQLEKWILGTHNGTMLWALISPYIECLGIVKADNFLRKINVLVTPSRAHETFCNVVMEAASLGCPAIVSDKGALPERVAGGSSGWIFPAGNALALSQQMHALIEQPLEVAAKSQAAFNTRALYAPNLQIDRLEQLLADVMHV